MYILKYKWSEKAPNSTRYGAKSYKEINSTDIRKIVEEIWFTMMCLTQLLRSSIVVKVIVPCVAVVFADEEESTCLPEPADSVSDDVFFWFLRLTRSDNMPGSDISSSFTCISPVSNFTTVDIDGRLLGMTWVHKRDTFKNLQASTTSKSSPNNASTNWMSSPFLNSLHACISTYRM